MLSFADLVALDQELSGTPTLTLYLDGRAENPAWRTAWRRALKQEETRLRHTLENAPHDEREQFAAGVAALEAHMALRRGALDAPGWLGVVAQGKVRIDAPLRGAVTTAGYWRAGVALAPFLCAPSEATGAWVAIVDSRAARIFRCDDEGVHRVDTVRTVTHLEPNGGLGAARRGKFHAGTRGGVRRDEAERERRAARVRMLHELAARVRELPPAAVFVGGTPQLLADAAKVMREAGVESVTEAPVLGARARVSEITRGVREGLAQLRHERDTGIVHELLQRFADDGLGLAGAAATGRALEERAVQVLVLSETFVTTQREVAEVFVRAALAQDAEMHVVDGDAARELEESGGVGALLRFSPFRSTKAPAEELAAV
jgi:hypothetical protein